MCRMVYLGTSKPLRLVPWSAEKPGFHVEAVQSHDEPQVRRWLGTPFICSVGSYQYCACGFQHGENSEGRCPTDPRDIEESAQEAASLAAFREYLHAALMEVAEVRVLACWSDDVGKAPEHRRDLMPDDLLRDDFYFLDGESSVFRLFSSPS